MYHLSYMATWFESLNTMKSNVEPLLDKYVMTHSGDSVPDFPPVSLGQRMAAAGKAAAPAVTPWSPLSQATTLATGVISASLMVLVVAADAVDKLLFLTPLGALRCQNETLKCLHYVWLPPL